MVMTAPYFFFQGIQKRLVQLLTLVCFFHFAGIHNSYSYLVVVASPLTSRDTVFQTIKILVQCVQFFNPCYIVHSILNGKKGLGVWVHKNQRLIENYLEVPLIQASGFLRSDYSVLAVKNGLIQFSYLQQKIYLNEVQGRVFDPVLFQYDSFVLRFVFYMGCVLAFLRQRRLLDASGCCKSFKKIVGWRIQKTKRHKNNFNFIIAQI